MAAAHWRLQPDQSERREVARMLFLRARPAFVVETVTSTKAHESLKVPPTTRLARLHLGSEILYSPFCDNYEGFLRTEAC